MLVNVLGCLSLAALAALFAFLARRALGLRSPALRTLAACCAAVPALVFAAALVVVLRGYHELYRTRPRGILAFEVEATPERIARGAHLASTTCTACHTENGRLPLSGGVDLASHSPVPIGSLTPPNLTPGGPLAEWSDAEIADAIRNGIGRDGRVLLMPTTALRNLSDEDLASLVAYLRTAPPVEKETARISLSPILALVFGAGLEKLGEPPVEGPVVAPRPAPTVEYGAYVESYQDCRTCHGPDLNGSSGGLAPPAPSARVFARAWTETEFVETMRTGVDPGGHRIAPPMPWQMFAQMNDVELAALYLYLRAPEGEAGARISQR